MPLLSLTPANCTIVVKQVTYNATGRTRSTSIDSISTVEVRAWLHPQAGPRRLPIVKPQGVKLEGDWLIGMLDNGESLPDNFKNGAEVQLRFDDGQYLTAIYVRPSAYMSGGPTLPALSNQQVYFNVKRQA